MRHFLRQPNRPPVQLWLPLFGHSPRIPEVGRDIERAFSSWQGEHRLWLLPGLSERRLWVHEQAGVRFLEAAIPSESFDRIDVLHVDADRRVYAPARNLQFLGDAGYRLPQRFYQKWVNCDLGVRAGQPRAIELLVPRFKGERVELRLEELKVDPDGIMDTYVDGDRWMNTWPPRDSNLPKSISPDAESANFHGRAYYHPTETIRLGDQDWPLVTSEKRSARALPLMFWWEPPFDECFFNGGGLDVVYARLAIQRLATEGDRRRTVEVAGAQAAPYLSEGQSTVEKTWFLPRVVADGEQNALFDLASKYDLDLPELLEVWDHPQYREIAEQPVEVLRAWGWAGYFWYELLRDLERGERVRACARCGKVIAGGGNKRYCSAEDDIECRRAYDRDRRRTERSRAKR